MTAAVINDGGCEWQVCSKASDFAYENTTQVCLSQACSHDVKMQAMPCIIMQVVASSCVPLAVHGALGSQPLVTLTSAATNSSTYLCTFRIHCQSQGRQYLRRQPCWSVCFVYLILKGFDEDLSLDYVLAKPKRGWIECSLVSCWNARLTPVSWLCQNDFPGSQILAHGPPCG